MATTARKRTRAGTGLATRGAGLVGPADSRQRPGYPAATSAWLELTWPPDRPNPHHGGMKWREVITADPDVVHGQVRFAGTRVPVSVVLDCLASGMSEAEILDEYPTLPTQAVRAALSYAAELARDDVLPLAASQ